MLIALNILLAATVVSGMVALFVHAIRSERRHPSSRRREGECSAPAVAD
jgi:hypothetical protein